MTSLALSTGCVATDLEQISHSGKTLLLLGDQPASDSVMQRISSDFDVLRGAPASPNSGSTYTSTTGWSIDLSATDPSVGYNASNQVSTTLPDFKMVNHTGANVASWTFQMSTSWRDMFKHPFLKKCKASCGAAAPSPTV